MKLFFLTAFLILISTATAFAGVDCADPQTTNDMLQCADQTLKVSDSQLNKNYQHALTKLPANVANALKETQRLWIAYKDKHCELMVMNFEGGTMAGPIRLSCLNQLTMAQNQQILDLIAQFETQEEDDSESE